jgi:hydroxyethylthiazole kinase
MTDAIDMATTAAALADLRAQRPLVHNITNYVGMTISANVLLALGASPAMVHAVEEAEDFMAISSSLVINIGTLSPRWVEAMKLAAKKAVSQGKPWVLDPVGCGATRYRTTTSVELSKLKPAVIRGNASEIMSLAGAAGAGGKGVDSTASSDAAIEAATALARNTGAVVAITGKTDYATDGTTTIAVEGSDVMLTLSTAMGCSLSATTAAFAAVREPLAAAVSALAVFGAAGAEAASRVKGPGYIPAELCDALYRMDAALLARRAEIRTAKS